MLRLRKEDTEEFKNEYYRLYTDYQKELMQISGLSWSILPKEEALKEDYEGYHIFLIESDGKIVGLVNFQSIFWTKPAMLYIDQLYIAPEFRRQHIGTAVINMLVSSLVAKNKILCWLYVYKNNLVAKTFWTNTFKNMGFKLSDKEKHQKLCITDHEDLKVSDKYIFY